MKNKAWKFGLILWIVVALTGSVAAAGQPGDSVLRAQESHMVSQPAGQSGYGKVAINNTGATTILNGVYLSNGVYDVLPGNYAGQARANPGYGFLNYEPSLMLSVNGQPSVATGAGFVATLSFQTKCQNEFTNTGSIYVDFVGAQIILNGIVLPNGYHTLAPRPYKVQARPLPGYQTPFGWYAQFDIKLCPWAH